MMGHYIENDRNPFGLCSEPDHINRALACSLVSASDAEDKLAEVREELASLHTGIETAWHAITFRRPPDRSPARAQQDAKELVRLDALGRKVRLTLNELAKR